jgi:uncharacterized membrane protein
MVLPVGLCLGLLIVRSAATGQFQFRFLVWNLLLAVIPYPLALASDGIVRSRWWWTAGPTLLLWLLFLPNAPYLVTDLVHLSQRNNVPYWYDTLLYGSFALTGMLLCFGSVALIHSAIRDRFGQGRGWVVAISSLLLSAYGLYLGRIERLNSWNALDSPTTIARRVLAPLHSPLENARTIGFVALYGALLCVSYLAVASIGFVLRSLTPTAVPQAKAGDSGCVGCPSTPQR